MKLSGAIAALMCACCSLADQTAHGQVPGYIVALKRKDTLVGDWRWHWLLDSSGNDGDALAKFEDLYEKDPAQACCRNVIKDHRWPKKLLVQTIIVPASSFEPALLTDRKAASANWKCATDISYQGWRSEFEDYRRHVPPSAQFISINGNAAMRVRDASGNVRTTVIAGNDPNTLTIRSRQFQLADFIAGTVYVRALDTEELQISFYYWSTDSYDESTVNEVFGEPPGEEEYCSSRKVTCSTVLGPPSVCRTFGNRRTELTGRAHWQWAGRTCRPRPCSNPASLEYRSDRYLCLSCVEHTSIRALVIDAIGRKFKDKRTPVLAPPVTGTGKRGPLCPDRENLYDLLFV